MKTYHINILYLGPDTLLFPWIKTKRGWEAKVVENHAGSAGLKTFKDINEAYCYAMSGGNPWIYEVIEAHSS